MNEEKKENENKKMSFQEALKDSSPEIRESLNGTTEKTPVTKPKIALEDLIKALSNPPK
jgi:hypothetical protein